MKKILFIPLLIFISAAVILLRPAMNFSFDKSVSPERILFQYEIIGCGGLMRRVTDGGEEITAQFISEYPTIGKNEVVFTKDSGEPFDNMDTAEFFTGGLAGKYTYIAVGEAVGVTRGALDCCEPVPAYNEKVVEFRVDKWYSTTYIPYIETGDIEVIMMAFRMLFISAVLAVVGVVVLLLQRLCRD